MAFKHGKNAELYLDSKDISAYFNDLALSIDVDTADTTTFKSTWKSAIAGNASSKIDAKGFVDTVFEPTLTSFIRNAGSVMTAMPAGGAAVGDLARLAWVHETSLAESSPVGGAVLMSLSALTDDRLGIGQILRPLSVTSGTTTGTGKDDTAATTTGWIAHLHVTAVSSGSWVIKIQDSADNSSWADVSGATFTAATTATSQRLSAATTATLRRYVRFVATVTGGSTPTITFALAYSRN